MCLNLPLPVSYADKFTRELNYSELLFELPVSSFGLAGRAFLKQMLTLSHRLNSDRYNDLLEELALHPDMLRVFRLETPHKRCPTGIMPLSCCCVCLILCYKFFNGFCVIYTGVRSHNLTSACAACRMRDREYILRFFALRRSGIENFYLPVKNWLNNEMRR